MTLSTSVRGHPRISKYVEGNPLTMSDDQIPAAFLYLHQMDQNDLQLYIYRLAKATQVMLKYHDKSEPSPEGAVRYRAKTTEDAYYTVHVRMIENAAGEPVFHLWTDHNDGSSNFTITDRLRPGEEPVDPSDPESVLERLYLLEDEVKLAFSDYGFVGKEVLDQVEAIDRKCLETLNALIHAYIEFDKGKRFVLEIHGNKPYSPCKFYERVGVLRFEFLTEATQKALDEMMPAVVKLEYTRSEGMSYYRFGPADPQEIVITAEDMPSEKDIRKAIEPIASVPAPHLLDEFAPLEQAA